MLGIREIHDKGPTHVSLSGNHLLTGGSDGVVALYPSKGWPQSTPLWARQCHNAGVTFVVLEDALSVALSCGRDGAVVLHERIHESGDVSTSRTICRVTGELRCLLFDSLRHRAFIAGDSLRCLRMGDGRFDITTIPFPVAHPVVALALSPCGNVLAVGNASGAVGVLCVAPSLVASSAATTPQSPQLPTSQLTEEDRVEGERYRNVRFVFPNVLPTSVKRNDGPAYRLCWCHSAGGLLLFVPSTAEVRVYRLDVSSAPPYKSQMKHIGGLHGEEMSEDYHTALCYSLSPHRIMCVMASASDIFIGKLDDRRLAMRRHASQRYDPGSSTGCITDVQVNKGTGDVLIGLDSGAVSLLRRAACKPTDGSNSSKKNLTNGPVCNDTHRTDGRTGAEHASDAACLPPHPGRGVKRCVVHRDSDAENEYESSVGSSESSSEASLYSTNSDEDTEDVQEVVRALRRSVPTDITDNAQRPSRWRKEDPKKALLVAEKRCREIEGSRFLDDEADEASAGSVEQEEDALFEEDGYGNRISGHVTMGTSDASDLDGEVDDGEVNGTEVLPSASAYPHGGVGDYSFQIGATLAGEEGNCYLAYNAVGYIHSTSEGTTIYFHDVSNPAVRIYEKGNILMGTLSPIGAGFVVAPQETELLDSVDESPRLTVLFRTFISIGAQSEWRVRLLPGETVRCMAAGVRHLAVATTRYLRIYSLSGLELAVLSKFPRIVAMTGTNSSAVMRFFKADFDPLAVLFREGGEHKLEVLDLGARTAVVPSMVVPLSEQPDGSSHQLQWMGWSDDGPLHVADTAGVVRMLTQSWGNSWVPVFDARSHVDQSYNLWIWGANDELLFAYRSSKTDSAYPAAVASGLPTEHVRLYLPLTRTLNEKDMVVWDHLLRREIRTDELKRRSHVYTGSIAKHDAFHDKKLMELFQTALKEQQTTRALDLAMLLELRDNVELCAKAANAEGYAQLVHKLVSLFEVRVKTKTKRKCALPLEGSIVSDKERDALLRKLLMKDQVNEVGQQPMVHQKGDVSSSLLSTSSVFRPEGTDSMAPIDGAPPTKLQRSEFVTPSAEPTSEPTSLPTTKRHISFDLPESSPTTPCTTLSSLPVHSAVDVHPLQRSPISKPRNPFTKSVNAVTGGRPSSAKSFTTAAATPSDNATPLEVNVPTSGEFLAAKSDNLVRKMKQPTPMRAPLPTPAHSLTYNNELPLPVESEVVILGDSQSCTDRCQTTTESEASNALRTRSLPSFHESCHSPSAAAFEFSHNTRGTPHQMLSPHNPAMNVPADPFLAKTTLPSSSCEPSHNLDDFDGPTVQAMLDVGHEESEILPRSESFGEALRKRYREDEDCDEDDESVVPAIPIHFS